MRVLLVDDHALFAQSLAIALSDFPSVEKFSNVRSIDEIETILEKDSPDILLMDINLGKLSHEDGLLLARRLLQKYPGQKIVILSGYDLPVYRKEAEKLGAKGFISKDIEPDKLLRILESIENGSTYFEHTDNFIEELTETEKQVLRLLSCGVKRKEIAEQLFMSERTVSNHLQHIFEKLGVSSAIEAVTKAIQSGYLPPL
ncbi:MAG TPA: response regulator transcription factor [Candidatus Eisenbergiella merdigallinarum]|uniref:Stage 0 sporulation protein A homolog n=1 Tax=Candidatus Eisenbergiella merdigallinarum TaxID=2838552 RepID=A0A9D2MSG4_9FIRM|nr:response regulator transcription factor [Candidatus Eisenbergiella merdigallinarum]